MHATGFAERVGQCVGALGTAIDDEQVADARVEQCRRDAACPATRAQ